jgi:hypothetical protein
VTTRVRVLRLTTNESYADACRPEPGEDCEFVRSCWAIGGPSDRACDAATAAGGLDELVRVLDPEAATRSSTVLGTRDAAAQPDVPTVYVETGTFFSGHGHLVQRVDGAWRVVVSQLVWQS